MRGMKCGSENCAWNFFVYAFSMRSSSPKRPPCLATAEGTIMRILPSVVFQPRTAYALPCIGTRESAIVYA